MTPSQRQTEDGPILDVRGLSVEFINGGRRTRVVDGVSFSIARGEIVGLVGESGSGKTVTALSLINLLPPGGRVISGRVIYDSVDVLTMSPAELRALRGPEIALIPPDASVALNPVLRVGGQVLDGWMSHRTDMPTSQARERVLGLFRSVGLPNPEHRFRRFPHELSGGMQQRVLIASALLLSPRLILADEPTTALDVTIQAQLLELFLQVRREFGTALLFVTHDLAVVAEVCDRVLVMYAGHIVESASVATIFSDARHPYTRALMGAIPPLGGPRPPALQTIRGAPPDPGDWPTGCRFAPRCPLREQLNRPEVCETTDPLLQRVGSDHLAACHFVPAEPTVDSVQQTDAAGDSDPGVIK